MEVASVLIPESKPKVFCSLFPIGFLLGQEAAEI